jgi:site-specific DNA-methyltransferase (cytosine-N4-specific)
MLTDEGDLVLDPFAGSCVTGEVCERLRRSWLCAELQELYLKGALGRFGAANDPVQEAGMPSPTGNSSRKPRNGKVPGSRESDYFKLPRVGLMWRERTVDKLPADGGKTRPGNNKVLPKRKRAKGTNAKKKARNPRS